MSRRGILLALCLLAACASGAPQPVEIDTTGAESCAFCRMVISDVHTAAEIVAPGEEPRLFDDIGCLRDYLASHPRLPRRAAAYVADHRSGALVPAAHAIYTRNEAAETPMQSRLFAHADAASLAADVRVRGAVALSLAQVFGASSVPEGK